VDLLLQELSGRSNYRESDVEKEMKKPYVYTCACGAVIPKSDEVCCVCKRNNPHYKAKKKTHFTKELFRKLAYSVGLCCGVIDCSRCGRPGYIHKYRGLLPHDWQTLGGEPYCPNCYEKVAVEVTVVK
jgi:hypothetical protein